MKFTTSRHTNWILSLSWIPFQMVNLQRVANPLLYLVLTAICIYLTVEVSFKCKIYYEKKSYMQKRMLLKQDIFRFLERETSTKVIWRIKSQETNNKNQVFLTHPRRGGWWFGLSFIHIKHFRWVWKLLFCIMTKVIDFTLFFNPSQVITQGSYIPTSSDDLPYITICPQPALK